MPPATSASNEYRWVKFITKGTVALGVELGEARISSEGVPTSLPCQKWFLASPSRVHDRTGTVIGTGFAVHAGGVELLSTSSLDEDAGLVVVVDECRSPTRGRSA